MSDVILLGPDEFTLRDRLETMDITVAHLPGNPIGADLEEAGVTEAGVLLLTSSAQASLIPVARELNPSIAVILYTRSRLPAFASAQADLSVDPELIDSTEVVDVVRDRIASTA